MNIQQLGLHKFSADKRPLNKTPLRFGSFCYNNSSSTPDLISHNVDPQPSSSSLFSPTSLTSSSSSSSAVAFFSSLPFPTSASRMPSFHLPSPSPYAPLHPFSAPPTPNPVCSSLPSVHSKDDSFLLSFNPPTQEPSSDPDLMARRRTKRYACLPTLALLDSFPTSISPQSSLSQLDLPCLNHLAPSEPSQLSSSPPAHLRSSSSNISTSSASLSPDPLFDSHPLPPVPRPRQLTLGRSSHSMMHLEHPSSPVHRTKENCRLSQLYSPNRPFDQRCSWHPPSTPGGTPELTTSPGSTPRPISTAYTTTTTSSSSPPEPSSRRALAIAELIDTETTYARDMAVVRDIYLAKALAEPVEACLFSPVTLSRGRPEKLPRSRPPTATCLTPKASPSSSSSALGSVLNFGARKRAAFKKSPPAKLGLVPQPTASPTLPSFNPSTPMSPFDRKTVFGNLEEVASFAEAFAGLLTEAGGGGGVHDGDSTDSIGACFIEMLPKIEQVFTTYCAKYESANNRLQELTPTLATYLEECQYLARGRTTAWDLPSLLIKPVQRCLKYPLLLDQILQFTPSGHPDRPQLVKARIGMVAVADSINETKRRHEYIEGIVGSPKTVPCRKPSRRTVPPASSILAKALARRSTRPSTADGVLARMILRLHQSKRAVMKLPAVLLAWSVRVREMNEQSGRVANTLRALHSLSSDSPAATGHFGFPFPHNGHPDLEHIDNYLQHVAIAASVGPLKVMEARLRSEIIPLCEQLNRLYENPMAVIACRDAKEAELAHSPNCSKLRELIEAIDAQLMTELPRFHAASARFLDGIMVKVSKVQQDLYFDLRVLHRHLAKSFRGDQQYHQDFYQEKLQSLSIVSSVTLSRGNKQEDHDFHPHESYILLDSPPTSTMEDDLIGHEHVGIAMTTSSPVLAAIYSRKK